MGEGRTMMMCCVGVRALWARVIVGSCYVSVGKRKMIELNKLTRKYEREKRSQETVMDGQHGLRRRAVVMEKKRKGTEKWEG